MKKINKKNLFLCSCVFVLLCFAVSGCGTSSKERIAYLQSAITASQEANSLVDQQIVNLQTILIPKLQAALAEANMPAEYRQKASDALMEAQTKLAQLQASKTKYVTAITNWKTQIDSIDANSASWADEITIVGKGGLAISPATGPAAPAVALISTALLVIGALGKSWIDANARKVTQNKLVQTEQTLNTSNKAVDELVTALSIFQEYLDKNPEAKAAYESASKNILTDPTIKMTEQIKAL